MMIYKASTLFLSRLACCPVWALLLLGLLIPAQSPGDPSPTFQFPRLFLDDQLLSIPDL